MRVKSLFVAILGLAGFLTIGTASAQDAPAATTPPPAEAPPAATAAATGGTASASKMRLGINLIPMPIGSLGGPAGSSADTAFAFGVMPAFDYLVHPNFFVGVGPSYTFNVKPSEGMADAAKQLDLLIRLGGGAPVAEKIQLFGYLSPGYSLIMPSQGDSAKGLTVGAHAGALFDVTSSVFASGTVGYQVGMQKFMDVDAKTQFLQIALGVGMRL